VFVSANSLIVPVDPPVVAKKPRVPRRVLADGWRHTAVNFTIDTTKTDAAVMERAACLCGARRFAWNTLLAVVKSRANEREQASTRPASLRAEAAVSRAVSELDQVDDLLRRVFGSSTHERVRADMLMAEADRLEKTLADRLKGELAWIWTGYDLISAWYAWKQGRLGGADAEGYAWLREIPSKVFEEAAVDLGLALAAKGRGAGFPKFKARGRDGERFRMRTGVGQARVTTAGKGAGRIVGAERVFTISSIGAVTVRTSTRRLRRLLDAGATIRSITIRRTTSVDASKNRYELALLLEAPARYRSAAASKVVIGVDLGLKTLAVCADASGREVVVVGNRRRFHCQLKRLARLQRESDRCKRGSKRHRRAVERTGKLSRRIRNQRAHDTHRATNALLDVASPGSVVVIETLHLRGMTKRRSLARAVHDASLGEVTRQLVYKAAWRGVIIDRADRFYPSSKRCSRCAAIKTTLLLSERVYRCEECGFVADRDLNAAANLAQWHSLTAAQRALILKSRRRPTSGDAKRADREPMLSGRETGPRTAATITQMTPV